MEWSAWITFDADGVRGTPDEPGVYEVRITPDQWLYEVGGSHVVYMGAGTTNSYTLRRLLLDHLHGRGNVLLKSLAKTHRIEFCHASVPNPSRVLSDLLAEFRRNHGGVPVCNRV
ncbi:MAG: hypothetical protein HY897_05695 [Deltaproteobacteria bacterium]|nr:hypothetical protein [Deltaproteobacteria bacterium]